MLYKQSECLSLQAVPKFKCLVSHQELWAVGLYKVIAMPLRSYKPDPANSDQHPTRLRGLHFPSLEGKKEHTRKQQNPQNRPQTPILLQLKSYRKLLVKDQGKQWPIYMHNSSKRRNPHWSYRTFQSKCSAAATKKPPPTTTRLGSEEALKGNQLVSHQRKTNNDSVRVW